jgi:hypothetical protein
MVVKGDHGIHLEAARFLRERNPEAATCASAGVNGRIPP